jgi:anti-sigma regulatory factor (Ser/Thr protein kinase)
LVERLALPHLEMTAWPGAVSCARHHARQLLWDCGLKELIEPVELVVSEIVTNAIRVSGGLDEPPKAAGITPIIRLWLSVEPDGVLVLVWDGSPLKPERQELAPDVESGRGLLLVELFSAAWGSFELANEPGKVVWALCQS